MNAGGRPPRVSVGIPVYNGEEFLGQALDGLLGQSFQDFAILISDNASTDQTGSIGRRYAARHPRVRYSANRKNLGLAHNHNRLVELASGEFFMWHAHDDQTTSEYLARCVDVLDRHPEVVLCFAKNSDIDERGAVIGGDSSFRRRKTPAEAIAWDAKEPHVRFRDVIQLDHQCEPDYGMMRLDVLRETQRHGKYADADRVLLAEMTLHGPFYMIQEPLFLHREHAQRSVTVYPDRQSRTAFIDPDMAGKIVLPHWRELADLWACTGRVPLDRRERLKCRLELLHWMVAYRGRLWSDLTVGVGELLRKLLPRPVQRSLKRLLRRG